MTPLESRGMWERLTPGTRKIITAALEEGGRRGHEEAGPDDLLLAMTRENTCAAYFMFEQAGIDPRLVTDAVLALPTATATPRLQRSARLHAKTMHVLGIAADQARRLGHSYIGTEHFILSLTCIDSNPASEVLQRLGFQTSHADKGIKDWLARKARPFKSPRDQSAAARQERATRNSHRSFNSVRRLVERIARVPALAWKVYVRKSLGHPGFVANPYPLYRKLRETNPVRLDPLAPVWIATSYDAVMQLSRDPRFKKDPFAGERLPAAVREQLNVPANALQRTQIETVSMLFLDPPEHTRIRAIFSKAFTLKRIEAMRPRIELICQKRLDKAAAKGEMELMSELAAPLPVTVIAEMLGFPPEDYAKIKKWSDEMAEGLALNPSTEAQARAMQARDELRVYFDVVIKQLEAKPGDNLLSALLADRDANLTREELFTNAVLLLAAGHETTTHLIGNGILALLKNPPQLQLLRGKPDLLDSAIEELLRYDPPVQWISRVAGEDIDLAGTRIPRGEIVLGALGAANRDPKYFPNPDRLDIQRPDNRHLSFGAGPHFCLGATLARMEAAIAISTLITRFPQLRLARQKIVRQKGLTFRGVKSLRLLL